MKRLTAALLALLLLPSCTPGLAGEVPANLASATIEYGDNSDEVLQIKQRMQELGYFSAGAELSGKFNSLMRERVQQFQQEHGLEATGRIDADFLAALYDAPEAGAAEPAETPEAPAAQDEPAEGKGAAGGDAGRGGTAAQEAPAEAQAPAGPETSAAEEAPEAAAAVSGAVLTIDAPQNEIPVGGRIKVSYTLENADALGRPSKKSWSVSDGEILRYSEGQVTGKAAGTAEIRLTLTFKDGSTLEASLPVTVWQPVSGVSLDADKLSLYTGDTASLTAAVAPENVRYADVVWASSDPSVVTVDAQGNLVALAGGKATVTATSAEPVTGSHKPKSASCVVTVTEPVSRITLRPDAVTVPKGSHVKLAPTVSPSTATNQKLTWTSADPSVATVSSSGSVTGVRTGTTTVRAEAADGSGAFAVCTVTVIQGVTSVKAESTRLVVFEGNTVRARATAGPADATNKSLRWSSSSSWIASVDQSGVITGKNAGTCEIYATSTDGTERSATIRVTVEPANPLSLESIGVGKYLPNLLGLTVRNQTKTCTIVDFSFDMTIYDYYGNVVTNGSFSLGSHSTISPGSKKTIKRTARGVGYASKIKITITAVDLRDGTRYRIPASEQETWTFTF